MLSSGLRVFTPLVLLLIAASAVQSYAQDDLAHAAPLRRSLGRQSNDQQADLLQAEEEPGTLPLPPVFVNTNRRWRGLGAWSDLYMWNQKADATTGRFEGLLQVLTAVGGLPIGFHELVGMYDPRPSDPYDEFHVAFFIYFTEHLTDYSLHRMASASGYIDAHNATLPWHLKFTVSTGEVFDDIVMEWD